MNQLRDFWFQTLSDRQEQIQILKSSECDRYNFIQNLQLRLASPRNRSTYEYREPESDFASTILSRSIKLYQYRRYFDDVELTDTSGTIFSDDMESGMSKWDDAPQIYNMSLHYEGDYRIIVSPFTFAFCEHVT